MKKIAQYSSLAAVFISGSANAQIIYTDIDPDIILDPDYETGGPVWESQYHDLYVDGDIYPDVRISAAFRNTGPTSEYSYYYLSNQAGAGGGYLGEIARDVDDNHIAAILETGMPVSSGLLFTNAPVDLCNYDIFYGGSHGNFCSSEYQFIGYRIERPAGYVYGWVRLTVDDSADMVIIHDYAVNKHVNELIAAGETGGCYPPSVSATTNISATSAKLNWAPMTGASKYQIKYREVGAPAWITFNAPGAASSKTIPGLTCNTAYEWKIKTRCGDLFSAFSSINIFTTASCRLEETEETIGDIIIYPNPASE